MSVTGSIAHNFHEGSRSEYLAQYIFSAFGTCVPVPHQEDSGIDFHCTLGEKIGKRLHVINYYSVQVKSNNNPWVFEDPKEIEWIVNHNYPLLYCVVNKKENSIRVYQTLLLALCKNRNTYLKRISLIPEPCHNPFKFQMINSKVDIKLGEPIIEFKIDSLVQEEPKLNYKAVLQSWLDLDQMNIYNKIIGFSLVNVPQQFKTNLPLEGSTRWEGDLFFEEFDKVKIEQASESFYKLFSQMINQVIYEKDMNRYLKFADFAGDLVNQAVIKDTWSIRLLAAAINNGALFFKLDAPRLSFRFNNGELFDVESKEPVSELYKSKMA